MDPDKALAALVVALGQRQWGDAAAYVGTLTTWHDDGGALPRWPDYPGPDTPARAAWHLGRIVAALDLANGNTPARGRAWLTRARADYGRALSALAMLTAGEYKRVER